MGVEACTALTVSHLTMHRKTVLCTPSELSQWCDSKRLDLVCGKTGGGETQNPAGRGPERGPVLPRMMAVVHSNIVVSNMCVQNAQVTIGGHSAGRSGGTQTCHEALMSSTLGGELIMTYDRKQMEAYLGPLSSC